MQAAASCTEAQHSARLCPSGHWGAEAQPPGRDRHAFLRALATRPRTPVPLPSPTALWWSLHRVVDEVGRPLDREARAGGSTALNEGNTVGAARGPEDQGCLWAAGAAGCRGLFFAPVNVVCVAAAANDNPRGQVEGTWPSRPVPQGLPALQKPGICSTAGLTAHSLDSKAVQRPLGGQLALWSNHTWRCWVGGPGMLQAPVGPT